MAQKVERLPSDDPLLALKFALPRPSRLWVERRRLITRLDEAAETPLVLVSAPAGSGKTALLAQWVDQQSAHPIGAWITFEEGDDRPETFWPLVLECLRRHGVHVPEGIAAEADPTRRALLTELSAALASLTHPFTLILDGYDVADAHLASDIEFVLEHAGHRLRLVILTRVDPVLPLHRFRLAGTVMEIRMADLAFSEEETSQLVARAGVSLSAGSVRSLVRRTRGWAAGLRFAVMVLAGRDDPDVAVDQIVGDAGNIAEYLTGEMLQTQPPDVRELLLRTCVVDTLRPGLIEELGGHTAARGLAALARANVLIEELADHPGCYRYHPFLRDLLRAEFAYAAPGRLRRLQRRAARWLARQGLGEEAAALAVTGGAWAEAADYAMDELVICQLISGDDSGGLVTSLRQIPADTGSPSASVVRAALSLARGDTAGCARGLERARELVQTSPSPVDAAAEPAIELIETVRACRLGETQALARADELLGREGAAHGDATGLILASKGVAQWHRGDLTGARGTLSTALHALEASESRQLRASTHAHLALVAALLGRLRQAQVQAMRSVALADECSLPPQSRAPEAAIALGWVSAERYDLDTGREHLHAAGSRDGEPIARALTAVVQARLLRAGGDAEGALTVLDGLDEQLPDHAGWLVDLLGLEGAEARVARGDPDSAISIVRSLESPDRAAAALVLGHAHARRGDWNAVHRSVTELVRGTSPDGLPSAVVGGRLLEAALELHRGSHSGARAAVARSLQLAAPEVLRRPFREAPPAVRRLLETESQLTAQHPWLPVVDSRIPAQRRAGMSPADGAAALGEGLMIQPLTAKEQEVLGHLSALLNTAEIAAAMFISVNTVRTHVANILRKLAVSRRNEAIRRARALSLIDT